MKICILPSLEEAQFCTVHVYQEKPYHLKYLLIPQAVSPVVLQIKTWTKVYILHRGGVARVDIHLKKSQVCLVLGFSSVCASVPPESSYMTLFGKKIC